MPKQRGPSEPPIQRAWGVTAAWIAGITTVIGFIGTLSGAFGNLSERLHRHKDSDREIAVAQTQLKEAEFPQAFATYSAVLKADPGYKPAVDGQLAAAERWVEHFEVDSTEDKAAVARATADLNQLSELFYAASADLKSTALADVQAHIGWVHWLQHHLLGQDTKAAAERDLRAALAIEPGNVYANAMLGNITAQTYGSLSDAVHEFDTAVASGKERAYVRRLQLAGLIRFEVPGARAALMRTLNAMRKGGEPLDADTRLNARGFCCVPEETTHEQWVETLTAVPSEEAFQTYVWLNDTNTDLSPSVLALHRLYVRALLTEIAGDRAGALQQLRDLNRKIDGINSSLDQCVPEEIERLTEGSRS